MNKLEKILELKSKIEVCTDCKLCKTRNKVVFGEGNPDSPLLIIGEGPGANEDNTGRPFVGRAGKLLDECLEECHLNRNRVFIANVIKCRACIISGKINKNRPPEKEEIEACNKWLREQIELINPKVILTLGAPSTKFILGREDIKMTKDRGKFYNTKYCDYVIPALHPSYILRNMYIDNDGGRSFLISDIQQAILKVRELNSTIKSGEMVTAEKEPTLLDLL